MKNERKNAEYRTGEDVERRHDWEREHAGRSRPHLAPCSCELHQALREALERNRELESSLHMEQMRVHDLKQDMEEGLDYLRVREQQLEIEKARAEKAERQAAIELQMKDNVVRLLSECQARVAELMKALDEHGCVLAVGGQHTLTGGRVIETKPAPATVGDETPSQGVQEREAD